MSARRAALGLVQWLGAVALFGAWLALAVVLPPAEFGALCLLLLACGAVVLVYRRGVRDGERRARREAEASAPPPAAGAAPVAPPLATTHEAVTLSPASPTQTLETHITTNAEPDAPSVVAPAPAAAQPMTTEPYPDAVDLAELGDLAGLLPIRLRLVLEPVKALSGFGTEREACTAVQIAGRWAKLDGLGWDLMALAASAREPGGYYLGNCGCGVPDCAGVWAPVQVRHEGERITWTLHLPYSGGVDARTGDAQPPGLVTLAFDAGEYRAQAAELVQTLRAAAADGGPLVRLNCHPGELPEQVLQWIDEGGAGWGGRADLPD